MTDRLYYTDARCTHFTATVVGVEADGRHLILDRTAFYPTSGGQPFDTGRLGAARIIDVIDEDHRIVHVCDAPTTLAVGDTVDGTVDWARRFDHMQQHSAQHLLSAWLADRYGWPTVSVHFGADTNTVDVTAAAITPEQLVTIEQEVNQLVADNRAITITFEDAATATGLRKPSDRGGVLRIVTIEGIDRSACGGTHVERTGSIGAILLRRVERTKGHSRVEFVAGLRAVARSQQEAGLLTRSARLFTAAPEELPALIETQQRRIAELERERSALQETVAAHTAQGLWQAATPDAAGIRHLRLPDSDQPVRDHEPLVRALVALGGCTVRLASPATRGLLVGASADSGVNAGALLKAALQAAGGRGGGSPTIAQGTVPDDAALTAVLTALEPTF